MVAIAFMPVTAQPAAGAPSANLLASALTPDDGDDHWMSGFAYRSELCPDFEVYALCDTLTSVPDSGTDDLVYVQPVGYRVTDECSTLSMASGPDATGRVVRLAGAAASFAAARELWTGEGTKADPFATPTDPDATNPYLAGPTAEVITESTANVMEALGLLEERARQRTRGQQVYLHVPIRIVTQVGAQLRHVGNEIKTHTDAVVIADAGYDGTGPDGTAPTAPATWAYATGPVSVRLGPIVATVDPVITLDRSTNRFRRFADRVFAVSFDPCCHFAIELNTA